MIVTPYRGCHVNGGFVLLSDVLNNIKKLNLEERKMFYTLPEDDKLDYSRPIFAQGKSFLAGGDKATYMLVPSHTGTYDWLNVKTGKYNSTAKWTDPRHAVKAYTAYKIYNKDLT